MLGAAEEAGAEVRRGAKVVRVEPGTPPQVSVSSGDQTETLEARLVVGADGRTSKVRKWIGLEPQQDRARLMVVGTLLGNTTVPDDSIHLFRKSDQGEEVLMFPLGEGRLRAYFVYPNDGERRGLSGAAQVPRFIESLLELDVPREWINNAEPVGPLAEFDGRDVWVEHPHRDGVVLVGDASGANDPAWGNGLSHTLHDVRLLRDQLLANEDWTLAGDEYAKASSADLKALRNVTGMARRDPLGSWTRGKSQTREGDPSSPKRQEPLSRLHRPRAEGGARRDRPAPTLRRRVTSVARALSSCRRERASLSRR